EIKPRSDMKFSEYKESKEPAINHFYEKLLLLKDRMNTKTGKELAEQRHKFMEKYLEQFFKEWDGKG
ncbi:MAG: phosphohydrolase, partial [Candidatus Aenigmatarchaeota archaeon]